ncbi:phospholipase D2-like [Uloborus diversus]|uniref:phospholipase D2-like n=1 Tax=Uloborus diversus TaxID=327109 RepID=UPI002409909E|nr:phospholipase D2-like [Uloborus diversus]
MVIPAGYRRFVEAFFTRHTLTGGSSIARKSPVKAEFFEIGPFSFIEDLGPKGKEGFVFGRRDFQSPILKCLCIKACPFRKKRWLFLKENFIGLIHPRKGVIVRVMLLDRAFKTGSGKRKAGHENAIFIQNLNEKLYLKCETSFQQDDWMIEFSYYLDRGIRDFVLPNRYESFAPPRPGTECKWIVDGATYFEAVAEALENAREEIFIADWWLTPEVYLKRPTVHGHYWQLVYILKRKAREGVKIYVLLFKELEVALGINSSHTEKKLKNMHKNIKVLRHPWASKGVLLWAHHEKIVCVDQTYAFVGGLDLCYGRWDDFQHRLSDFGAAEDDLKVFRHMSIVATPSMEKHVHRRTSSLPSAKSESSIETQVFEGIKKQLSMEDFEPSAADQVELPSSCPVQIADQQRVLQEMTLKVLGIDHKFRLWIGKDYANFISRDFENLHEAYSDNIDRGKTPRMPWHDVGMFLQGRAARDVARHFILRWNHSKVGNSHFHDTSIPLLMPKAYENFDDDVPSILKDTAGRIYRTECQVLRSLSFWSGHITETECSIHNAYIDLIRNAKHFIYIENQFFITQPESDKDVHNGIADALYNRIIKAHRNQETFRVYVVLPLLPAFEGELGTGTGTCIQAITHWNYKSICRGPTSLYQRLARRMKDPTFYISFYGLRTHGVLKKKLVTELVYVHSKLLIVDDNAAIIGSANINDRSLLGRRDSEIAVVVHDTQFVDIKEEIPHQAGVFCYSLRTALFKEHLGLMHKTNLEIDLQDPSSDEFFAEWTKIALKNTEIYEEVSKHS